MCNAAAAALGVGASPEETLGATPSDEIRQVRRAADTQLRHAPELTCPFPRRTLGLQPQWWRRHD